MSLGGGTGKAIETLEELSVVNFPRNVDEREVYRILKFVSGDLNYKTLSGNFSGFFSIEHGKLKEKYEAEIKGMISSKDFSRRATFSFPRKIMDDCDLFTSMRFDTIVDYDLEEHDQNEVQAWRDIGRSIKKYFSENPEPIEDNNQND